MKRSGNMKIAGAGLVLMMALSACTEEKSKAGVMQADTFAAEGAESREENEAPIPEKQREQESSGKDAAGNADGLTDEELEEELDRYRKEREDMIQIDGELIMGGSPDERNYHFDMSGMAYAGRFNAQELTQAYDAAETYVKDTLGIEKNTKMTVYMCVDPRILAIYEEGDKGFAAGYDNSNIFVCEYCTGQGIWQYLILVRDGIGSPWHVVHHGSSFRDDG